MSMNIKYLRVTVYPEEESFQHLYHSITRNGSIHDAKMLHWNVSDYENPIFVFSFEGSREAFRDALENDELVKAYDITRVGDIYYAYVHTGSTPMMRELWKRATKGGVVLVPPLRHGHGGIETTVIGEAEVIQEAFVDMPDGVEVDVHEISEEYTRSERSIDNVVAVLSDRQVEAVVEAMEAGYYAIPREATHEDIAERMGCAPSTAAEHLRKAESKIMSEVIN